MEFRILHFYPDLMSLYGSYANLSVLRRHLESLGNTVTIRRVEYGDRPDIAGADFLFMGAGTERSQQAALRDFVRLAPEVLQAAEAGVSMLFAGTAMELPGSRITDAEGRTVEGIGLCSFSSVQQKKRIVGDVCGHTDLYPEAVVGFMNKSSILTGVETPLLTGLDLGFGNEAENGPEGFRYKNVLGSHLTGPLLVKNPRMLDHVLAAMYAHRGERLPDSRPKFPYEEDGYTVTAEQLRLRCGK